MGVPTFFRWICVRYPKVIRDTIEREPVEMDGRMVPVDLDEDAPNGDFDNLYLDMNGIIHPCCHPEDGPAPEDEEHMYENIFLYLDRLFRIVRPKRLVYMAIDGVAPRAKMNQQRARRFRAAQEREEMEREQERLRQDWEAEGRTLPNRTSGKVFDSNVITPGTNFLHKMSEAIRYYIHDRTTNDPLWQKLKFRVILSDANVPSEGEHKIMEFIRLQRAQPDYDPNTRHCLYGADADLIMLGLATHEAHFSIIREVVIPKAEKKCTLCGGTGHVASECTGDGDDMDDSIAIQKPFQIVSLPVLRQYLQLQFAELVNRMPETLLYDFERCVDDFVFMCFFVGNDFLPHLPSLSIRDGSIDQMIALYALCLKAHGLSIEVAHHVGLREEDDEEEWARILARGPGTPKGARMGPAAAQGGIPGRDCLGPPPKRRRYLNYVTIARVRLQDLSEEDGENGFNQHQIRADLETILQYLDKATRVLEEMTRGQGGCQISSSYEGLSQAGAAVETALGQAVQGDLDWMSPSWGQTMGLLLEEAEQLHEELGVLNFVHPADVRGLDEGGVETPPCRQGAVGDQLRAIVRDLRGIVPFLAEDGEQVTAALAAVTAIMDNPIEVDTQTTEGGSQGMTLFGPTESADHMGEERPTPFSQQATVPWVPPLHMEQWNGSIPEDDRGDMGPSQPTEPTEGEPTDAELVAIMEDLERQEEAEMRAAAAAQASHDGDQAGDTALDPEDEAPQGGLVRASSHRRRRMHALLYDDQGGFRHPDV
ncbi:Xrn2 [Symbiodinium sp. CCMP2592]|nr:Xrn2 [Symbiodinium sp. CCMP2592]